MNEHVRIYGWLINHPEWHTVAIFLTLTVVALRVGRHIFENLPYDISHASAVGDLSLLIAMLIAVDVLKRGVEVPMVWQNWVMHITTLSVAVTFGVFIQFFPPRILSARAMDAYHDIIIAPGIFYLAWALVPVVWVGGTLVEQIAAAFFVSLWAVLVWADFKWERMDQPAWFKRNIGIFLKSL